MTNPQWPVGQHPVTIFQAGQGQPANALQNMDNTLPVYADTIPMMSTTQGTLVNAGAILPWPAGKPLYVIAPSGTVNVQLLNNDQLQFWDPVSLANQIVSVSPGGSTLAQQIAQATNALGVPPVDAPVTLFNANQSVPSGVTPTPTSILDVRRYTAAELWVGESGITTASTLNREIQINWYSDIAATDLIVRKYYYYAPYTNGNMGLQAQIPSGAAACRINPQSLTTTQTTTMNIRVYASTRAQQSDKFFNFNNIVESFTSQQGGTPGWYTMLAPTVAAGVFNQYPRTYAGNAYLHFRAASVSTAINLDVIELWSGNYIAQIPLTNAVLIGSTSLMLPRAAIQLEITAGTGGATGVNITMVMEPW